MSDTFITPELPFQLFVFLVDDCLLNSLNVPKVVALLHRQPEDIITKLKDAIVNKTAYARVNNMFNSNEWKIQRENYLLREENKKLWLEIQRLKGTDIPDPPERKEETTEQTPLLRNRISKMFT